MSNKTKDAAETKASKPVLVPKLRFPEFRDNWSHRKLGELGRFYGGGTPSKSIAEYWSGDIPWVSSSDLYEDDLHSISVTRHISQKALAESATKIVPKNSVLFVSRVGVGKLAIAKYDLCTSQDFTSFYSDEVYNFFVGYSFLAHNSVLVSLGQGTSIKGFSKDDLAHYQLCYPKEEREQRKIADCLSSLDELITVEAQKVEALKTHKRGLMQLLFPAEGETVPKLRFPEFRNAGEWKMKRLSNEVDLISGMHLSPDQYNITGEVPYFTGPTDFTSDINGVTKWTKRSVNMSVSNDTLITVKGSGIGEVWYSTLPAVAIGRQLMAVRVKQGSSQFIFQLLLKKKTRFEDLGAGNLIPGLSRTDILEMETQFPSSDEQQRIANCLSSIDELITAQVQKVEALKAHKKGLMQQLFPNPDEIAV